MVCKVKIGREDVYYKSAKTKIDLWTALKKPAATTDRTKQEKT